MSGNKRPIVFQNPPSGGCVLRIFRLPAGEEIQPLPVVRAAQQGRVALRRPRLASAQPQLHLRAAALQRATERLVNTESLGSNAVAAQRAPR